MLRFSPSEPLNLEGEGKGRRGLVRLTVFNTEWFLQERKRERREGEGQLEEGMAMKSKLGVVDKGDMGKRHMRVWR